MNLEYDRFRLIFLALVVSFLALGFGCGGDDDTNNGAATNNGTMEDAGNNGAADVDNTGATYESSYELRFASLDFDADSPGASLDAILEDNFDQTLPFPIIVLLDLQNIDTEAGTFQVRGGAGLKAMEEGVYEWHPEADDSLFDGTLVPDSGEIHIKNDLFQFVATVPTESDPIEVAIPIHSLQLDGKLALADGGATASIPEGRLEGYVTREDADDIMVSLGPDGPTASLTTVLKASQTNYDTASMSEVDKGTGDAWYLRASFTAVSTQIDDGN